MLNGKVSPGDVVAVVGAGPIGLSVITGARLFSPAHVIAIDLADARLDAAKQFGADVTVNSTREDPAAVVRELTGGLGADVAIEAVGVPESSSCARSSLVPAGPSRTSVCTAGRPPCTWRTCGSGTSPSPRGLSTPTRPPRRCGS